MDSLGYKQCNITPHHILQMCAGDQKITKTKEVCLETSALMLVQKIKAGSATSRLWQVLVHDLALNREEFANLIGYHRNTVSRWEQKLTSIPVLYKQYWNGKPRSLYLDRYQIVVLLTLLMIKQEYRGHNVAGRLRQATFSLDKESIIESIEVLKHV